MSEPEYYDFRSLPKNPESQVDLIMLGNNEGTRTFQDRFEQFVKRPASGDEKEEMSLAYEMLKELEKVNESFAYNATKIFTEDFITANEYMPLNIDTYKEAIGFLCELLAIKPDAKLEASKNVMFYRDPLEEPYSNLVLEMAKDEREYSTHLESIGAMTEMWKIRKYLDSMFPTAEETINFAFKI